MGYTENRIFINVQIDKVFDITNRIDRWKDLFSEYKESTVLKKEENKITFRLTTRPEEDGHSHSWVSERVIDKENYRCTARRLEPNHPFEYMNITWEYSEKDTGTEMIWIQDFKPAVGCPWNDEQFEDYLNRNSKIQMKIIKDKIEQGFE